MKPQLIQGAIVRLQKPTTNEYYVWQVVEIVTLPAETYYVVNCLDRAVNALMRIPCCLIDTHPHTLIREEDYCNEVAIAKDIEALDKAMQEGLK